MYKIRIAATQVYVYLKHWVLEKKDFERPPDEFLAFNKRYQIKKREVLSTTMKLVEERFQIGILEIKDPKTFYNNFIIKGNLLIPESCMNNYQKLINHLGILL